MNRFTRDEPFEFDHLKVWRDERFDVWVGEPEPDQVYADDALAIHAFIEAERDEWAWTNEDHTEARKGRWVARMPHMRGSFEWSMYHEDLPNIVCVHPSPGDESYHRYVREALNDFLAWKSAQEQPAEPTGLGAVVAVESRGVRFVRGFGGSWEGNYRVDGWPDITALGPVTILSPGVTP